MIQLPIVTLNRAKVKELFEEAESQADYLLGLYRMVYGDAWDGIEKIEGWPKVSVPTALELCGMAVKFDARVHPSVFAGGLWLNNGFTSSEDVRHAMRVIPAPVHMK